MSADLQADLALALLLDIQQGNRDDLRLLVCLRRWITTGFVSDCLMRRRSSRRARAFGERRYPALAAHLRFDEAVAMATAEFLRQKRFTAAFIFTRRRRNTAHVHEHLASRVGAMS